MKSHHGRRSLCLVPTRAMKVWSPWCLFQSQISASSLLVSYFSALLCKILYQRKITKTVSEKKWDLHIHKRTQRTVLGRNELSMWSGYFHSFIQKDWFYCLQSKHFNELCVNLTYIIFFYLHSSKYKKKLLGWEWWAYIWIMIFFIGISEQRAASEVQSERSFNKIIMIS